MFTYILLWMLASQSVQQPPSAITWSESRKLSWEDFKAVPDAASTNAAMTNSIINIEFGFDDTSLEYSISCKFDKKRSWVKVRTAPVLQHEQGHFDIAEVYARKLAKEMKGYRFNRNTVQKDVNGIYDRIMAAYQHYQQLYDRETDFSRNKEKQAEWLTKIASELKALEDHSGYAGQQVITSKK